VPASAAAAGSGSAAPRKIKRGAGRQARAARSARVGGREVVSLLLLSRKGADTAARGRRASMLGRRVCGVWAWESGHGGGGRARVRRRLVVRSGRLFGPRLARVVSKPRRPRQSHGSRTPPTPQREIGRPALPSPVKCEALGRSATHRVSDD